MPDHILPGDPPVPVTLRRSARARRLSLRVSGADGQVTLTMPLRAHIGDGLAFLREREDWLRGHLARAPQPLRPFFGGAIPFEGRDVTVVPEGKRVAHLRGTRLLVPPDPERLPHIVGAWLRAMAHKRLLAAVERHSAALGRPFRSLALRDPRSRWGSCTADGDLMFSWRLVLAPPSVLDYVAAHEVAHLARMDHSPAFWKVVAQLYPGWELQRDWLRREGAALHRLRV